MHNVIERLDELNDLADNVRELGSNNDRGGDEFHDYVFNLPVEIAILREFILTNRLSADGLNHMNDVYIPKNQQKLIEWRDKLTPPQLVQ